MPFDGHYAAAQLWKLDTSPLFKGRYFQLSSMLSEFLMTPAFPSARFKAWAEKYNRLIEFLRSNELTMYALHHEGIPSHLSSRADISCRASRTDGDIPVRIFYHGPVEQYLRQREEVFGTALPVAIEIQDWLTDEEVAFADAWHDRYNRSWPFTHAVCGPNGRLIRIAHPRLRDLYERSRASIRRWDLVRMSEPSIRDVTYIQRIYAHGELDSEVLIVRHPDNDTDEED